MCEERRGTLLFSFFGTPPVVPAASPPRKALRWRVLSRSSASRKAAQPHILSFRAQLVLLRNWKIHVVPPRRRGLAFFF